jgi:CheY-like chemotaxis protein
MPTKILAIDDSKTMRLAIKITFAAEDAKVTAVSKGSEAVARAKQMQADVVLVDHALAPGEPSGFEVVQALKQNPATANIPVILLVPARGGVSEADIAAAGADNYIGKPFDSQELIDKVAAALGRGASSKPAVPRPAVAPAAKPAVAPVAAKPAVAPVAAPKTPAATPSVGAPKTPAVGAPKTPAATPSVGAPKTPVAARPAAAPATPAAAKPAPAKPVAPTPARAPATPAAAAAKPSAVRTVAASPVPGAAAATGGPATIPIAIPIPFTAASSPTSGMLERIKAAAAQNGAVAGLDPAAVRALLALSQEVVEQVVWEVVPDLAEEMIKQKMG